MLIGIRFQLPCVCAVVVRAFVKVKRVLLGLLLRVCLVLSFLLELFLQRMKLL
jgi:hypothetical protein|tara:strand:- start:3436 stop:3594 length:159 start_codon:yes stop_codon:yes gene_type:complete